MKKLLACLLAAFIIFTSFSFAQPQTSSVTASATIQTPISFGTKQNLSFGNLYPNQSKSIPTTDNSNCGKWQIFGEINRSISVTFSNLPSSLTDSYSNSLSLSYSNNDAGYANIDGSTQTTFHPNDGATINLGSNGRAFLYIGGTVSASQNQTPGVYSGTITITVNYVGS